MLSILSCVCWQSVYPTYLLWRNVYLGLLPIFGLGCLFFWYWAAWAACIFWRWILWQLFYLQIFSPILRAVFLSTYLFKGPISKYNHILRYLELRPQHVNLGGRGTIQPISGIKVKITLAKEDCDQGYYHRGERPEFSLNSTPLKGRAREF